MKIYVVMSGEWEDNRIEKLFLSEQKAQEYCDEMNLLLPDGSPDICYVNTHDTYDDRELEKTRYAMVYASIYEWGQQVDFIDYAHEPVSVQQSDEDSVEFTIDVSTCENYSEVMELAEETLEKLKESGEL